ncbi:hypothetical protein H072_808 [Dactylellina haptotyla CBS 200.50]|uniref:AAA+ ATPase domain-containing protein n=1 Tax=Dactylellina haptotyla (strain CBS 200.50) TaxID=1284197 RepID=S8AQR1_DACHA|nr:hypothetical protein H072_808 [Dactylellina haptotyla CBS 200.50]
MSQPWDYIALLTCAVVEPRFVVEVEDGKKIKLQIWDTAGQEQYRSVTNSYIRNATGALLVYDITRMDTLTHVQHWLSDIRNLGEPHISIVLVGNKCDLTDKRQVPTLDAETWARENGIEFHVETSAKTGESVEKAFVEVAKEIYRNIRDGVYDPRTKNNGVKAKNPRSKLHLPKSSSSASSPSWYFDCYGDNISTRWLPRWLTPSKILHDKTMFSEYASRFLAKSTLRDGGRQSTNPQNHAPLFFSAADYPTDDREHDQEVSAIYALQKSRRNLYYSTDQDEEEDRNGSDGGSVNDGIRSSWNPGQSSTSDATETAGYNNMVDVSLGEASLTRPFDENVLLNNNARNNSYSEASRHVEDPNQPPLQKFRPQTFSHGEVYLDAPASPKGILQSTNRDYEHGNNASLLDPAHSIIGDRSGSPTNSIPQPVDRIETTPPTHDRIWTKIYGGAMAYEYPGQQTLANLGPDPIEHNQVPRDGLALSIEFQKSNCLLLGPSGTGKTLIAKTLAKILDVPFSISDCTAFTQAGYVGEDVEVCVQRLLAASNWDTRRAETGIICLDEVDKIASTKATSNGRDVSGEGVQQALLKILEGTTLQITNPKSRQTSGTTSSSPSNPQMGNSSSPFQNFGSFGSVYPGSGSSPKGEIHTIDTGNILFILCGAFNGLNKIILDRISKHSIGFNAPVRARKSDANTVFIENVGQPQGFYSTYLHHQKTYLESKSDEPGVQNRQNKVNILEFTEPRDLISFGFLPEFVGRLPILTALETFDEDTLVRVLSEPRNSLLRQYEELFNMSGVELKFTSKALKHIAQAALTMDTGARALRAILERLLLDAMYETPGSSVKYVLVNSAAAKGEQAPIYFARGQHDRFQAALAAEERNWDTSLSSGHPKLLPDEGDTNCSVAARAA